MTDKVYTIKLTEGEIKAIGLHIADVPMSELHELFAKEAIKKVITQYKEQGGK